MARQQRMVGIIDLTGKDSDEVQEVVNDIGRSMIRGRSEMKPCHGFDANKANIPVDNLGRQSLGANASPPLPLLPVPSFQDSSSFRDIPLQDRPDTINPLDGSKAKKICKWEHYPYVISSLLFSFGLVYQEGNMIHISISRSNLGDLVYRSL
jgi:hypothetical protein